MLKDLAYALSLGTSVIFSISFLTYIGFIVDGYFKTTPIFMTIGILAGVLCAFLILVRMVKK